MGRNMSRRHFLKTGGLVLAAMAVKPSLSSALSKSQKVTYVSLRPPQGKRLLISKAVEMTIEWR